MYIKIARKSSKKEFLNGKTPSTIKLEGFFIECIWGLFTFPHVIAVSSTAVGLTSLFEMGRGEHYSYQPHKVFFSEQLSVNSYQLLRTTVFSVLL